MCPACARLQQTFGLCSDCRSTLVVAPGRAVGPLLVRAGYQHEGAARRLVHRLKYRGAEEASQPIVERLVDVIRDAGDTPSALVPVPRAVVRRGIYGSDPAVVIATRIGKVLGIPVQVALRSDWWWPRHAGRGVLRRPPGLARRGIAVPIGAALVDDVVTTGATLRTAARLVPGASLAYTATIAGRPVGPLPR